MAAATGKMLRGLPARGPSLSQPGRTPQLVEAVLLALCSPGPEREAKADDEQGRR